MSIARDAQTIHPDGAGERSLVLDAGWASLCGSLYSGVVIVGFALSLGATPFYIGALSAVPLFGQLAQFPAIMLVERLRRRRAIAVSVVTTARVLIFALAMLSYVSTPSSALVLLFAAEVAITCLGSVAGCAFNSWLHQLIDKAALGAFFARRLLWSTVGGAVGALAAGFIVDRWPFARAQTAYSLVFALGGLAGFASSLCLTRVPEPPMPRAETHAGMLHTVLAPMRDRAFRPLIAFMVAWNFASNLAAPFIAVYVMRELSYPLGTVTSLWVTSQLANALTLYVWGRLSDRLSNKSVLAVALPLYFVCFLGIALSPQLAGTPFLLPSLYAVHLLMGLAAGGIGLASGSLGMKLAPRSQATSYLAGVSLSGALAGGAASLLGGVVADVFDRTQLSLVLQWTSPFRAQTLTVLRIEHWGFLFAIAALLGVYVLHVLSRIHEEGGASQRTVVQQFVTEAIRSLDHLSSVEGLRLAALFPIGELMARRRDHHRRMIQRRRGTAPPADTPS